MSFRLAILFVFLIAPLCEGQIFKNRRRVVRTYSAPPMTTCVNGVCGVMAPLPVVTYEPAANTVNVKPDVVTAELIESAVARALDRLVFNEDITPAETSRLGNFRKGYMAAVRKADLTRPQAIALRIGFISIPAFRRACRDATCVELAMTGSEAAPTNENGQVLADQVNWELDEIIQIIIALLEEFLRLLQEFAPRV